MRIAVRFGFVICFFIAGLPAQELAGRITGTVRDEGGGVVPGASVTAVHTGTNSVYRAITKDNGHFAIPSVRLGFYRVTVEMDGFAKAVVPNAEVTTGGAADLNVTLQVGTIQEEVVVTADQAQEVVNTVDAELSNVVDRQGIIDLPLNGRNASHLALLQAGVFFERSADGQGDKLFVHGQRHRSINITLDGIDTQDNLNRASSIMIDQPLIELSAEHVQEFRVVTGIASAEYSRGGAHVSAVTRSGNNDWNGAVFYFNRNTALNANEFFNNSTGTERPPLLRHQFGFSLGGPIIKDKTFFYAGYEQLRENRGIAVNRVVWTAEARQGIFRYLDDLRTTPENVAANPDLIRSVNLFACGASVQAVLGRDCVDDRFSAANPTTLDPFISSTVLPAIPLPNNFVLGDGLNTGGFRFNSESLTFLHKPSLRIDHQFTDQHAFNFSFNYNDRNIQGDFINGRETIYPALGPLGFRNTLSRSYAAGLNSTLSSTLINELRAGLIWGENAFIRNQPFGSLFQLDFDDITDPFDVGGGDTARVNKTFNLRDSVSWVKGNHQFRFGGEWRHRSVNNRSLFGVAAPFGEIDFNDSDNPPGFSESDLRQLSGGSDIDSNDLNNGEELFNNLAGLIGEVEFSYNAISLSSGFVPGAFERRIYLNRELDLFFQDSWNVTPGLTLNLGLRWEWAGVPIEDQGLSLVPEGGFDAVFGISGPEGFFNPGVLSGRPCPVLQGGPTDPTTDNVLGLITGCAVPYVPGGSNNGLPFFNNDFNNFAPVIGLAWDPGKDGRTSIRAGFRISYQQDVFAIIDGNIDDNEGLQVGQECVPRDGNCLNNISSLREVIAQGAPPIPPAPEFQLPAIRTILDSTAQDFRTFVPDLATPYYEEWTLGIQRMLWRDWAVEARYVGNHGLKQRRVADFNEINVNAFDSGTGMSFLDAYLRAQQNLSCNRANGAGDRFDSRSFACSVDNPLMDLLIGSDAARLRARSALIDALNFNEVGEFIYRLTQVEVSRPSSGQSRIRGGAFWGLVLEGRLPANFFQANPFINSSRAMINDGSSQYHALELEMRRRFSQGFSFQANYTYGKALADFDGDENTLLNDTRPSSVINPRSTRQEFMPRHLFKANWIYELPIGDNKRFSPTQAFLRHALSGWQFGGIVNYRNGRPLTITSGVGSFHRGAISDDNTVNLSQNISRDQIRNLTGRQDIGGGVFWLDPCLSSQVGGQCTTPGAVEGLFTLPTPGQLGQLGESAIFGPSSFNFDFNLQKSFAIGEDYGLEFRWEVFNAFNNVNFDEPATGIFGVGFGQITRTLGNPRLMQFALRLTF